MQADLLIRDACVVTVNARREVWGRGAVAVRDGRFVAVGDSQQLTEVIEAQQVIDATGKVLFPGMINTHTHLYQTLLKGLGNGRALIDWLHVLIHPVLPHLTPELAYAAAMLGAVEALHSGTTTLLDYMVADATPEVFDAIVQAGEEVGIRLYLGRGLSDLPREGLHAPSLEEGIRDAQRLRRRYGDRIWLSPGTAWQMSDAALQRVSELARDEGFHVTIHTNEVTYDNLASLRASGLTNIERLERSGLLGPQLLAVHCVNLSEDEISAFARHGVAVSYNPVSNMILGSGLPPIRRMLHEGLRVGLATDGAASNDSQDMVEALKFAVLFPNGALRDPALLSAYDAVQMATRGAAAAMGIEDENGSIEEGKRADCFLFDPAICAKAIPLLDPVSTLVFSSSLSNISMTMVDGHILMLDRKILSVDEAQILREAQAAAEELVSSSGVAELMAGRYRLL